MNQENEPKDLRTRVFRSLDSAMVNGYDNIPHLPANEVADDLADFDADLEGESTEEMAVLFTEWRAARFGT
jgi:hypothetical protein